MTKEFVTYEQALALKELGFDEPCFAFWEAEFSKPMKQLGKLDNNGNLLREKTYSAIITDYPEYVLAPLKQQVFRWFREKYRFEPNIIFREYYYEYGDKNVYEVNIESNIDSDFCLNITPLEGFKSYDEAESACIDKLIELVKNK